MGYHEEPKDRDNTPDVEPGEEYAFLQETLKDEKERGKARRNRILKTAGRGLVFGIAASLGFFAVKPWAEKAFFGNPAQVTIPEEEIEEEAGEEEQEVDTPALTVDNYREMNEALRDVGNEAERCVAEIIGAVEEDDWQDAGQNSSVSVSGVIVADNGPEILIFGSSLVAQDAGQIRVKFADGKICDGEVKQKDENLGFAVYSVPKSRMSDSTKSQISVAVLGMSGSLAQGDTIIALGSPFGYSGAMGFGVVASSGNSRLKPDGEYRMICTDISGSRNGTGVLVNIRGEIVGIIDQSIIDEESTNLVVGYGISDLKSMIELLSNGMQVPYLGIVGVTVTEEIAKEQGIPEGVYVQEVQADSPAMSAGIQSGDVIVGIGDEKTATISAFHSQLLKRKVGSSVELKAKRKGNEGYVDVDYDVTIGSCE